MCLVRTDECKQCSTVLKISILIGHQNTPYQIHRKQNREYHRASHHLRTSEDGNRNVINFLSSDGVAFCLPSLLIFLPLLRQNTNLFICESAFLSFPSKKSTCARRDEKTISHANICTRIKTLDDTAQGFTHCKVCKQTLRKKRHA